jgi:hypothetical protein
VNIFEELEAEQAYRRRRTAIHESGHVLANWFVDRRISGSVVCLWPGNGRAHCAGGAAASLGGVVALEVIGDAEPTAGADDDLRYVREEFSAAEQAAAWSATRSALRKYRPALEHFAQSLESHAGRLAGHEVKEALEAALAYQERLITAEIERRQAMDEQEYSERYRASGEAEIDHERAQRIKRGILATRPKITEERAWAVAVKLAADGRFVDEELVSRSLGEPAKVGEVRITPDRPRVVERKRR